MLIQHPIEEKKEINDTVIKHNIRMVLVSRHSREKTTVQCRSIHTEETQEVHCISKRTSMFSCEVKHKSISFLNKTHDSNPPDCWLEGGAAT